GGHAQHLHARAVVGRRARGQAVGIEVVQRLVVVVLDVVDDLARRMGVAGRLAVVVHLVQRPWAVDRIEHVVAHGAGPAGTDEVRRAQQGGTGPGRIVAGGEFVGRVAQAVEPALARDLVSAAVARTTTAQRIAAAVAEGADAAAAQGQLRGLD